jgi:hypothetical protein
VQRLHSRVIFRFAVLAQHPQKSWSQLHICALHLCLRGAPAVVAHRTTRYNCARSVNSCNACSMPHISSV